MTHHGKTTWLKCAGLGLVLIGIFFSWVTSGAMSVLNEGFIDLAYWPFDGKQTYQADETKLLSGIAGGLTVGIGLAVWLVAIEVYSSDPARGRRIILTFMLGWFVVDSVGSILAGAWFNTVLNAGILALVCGPIASATVADQRA